MKCGQGVVSAIVDVTCEHDIGFIPEDSVQFFPMKKRKDWAGALLISVCAAFITLLPFIYASVRVNPGFEFTGFLLNPWDGFTYLAKMQQGEAGAWGFQLPYALDPGPETYLYFYYILLGKFASWIGSELIVVFHGARFLASTGMFFLAYLLFERVLPDRRTTWFAFLLVLFGSGLGWLPLLLHGVETSDIAIPESIPFLLAYSNAHFPVAAASILGAILAMLGTGTKLWIRAAVAFVCGSVLVIVLPFSVVSLIVTLSVWIAWEWRAGGGGSILQFLRGKNRARSITFFWLLLAMVPWILYDTWIVLAHPVISAWSSQNITPSPPLWQYLFGYGLILLLSVIGVIRAKPFATSTGRLLIVWGVSSFLLLYAPIGLQRRLNLGLYFPLAALAAFGLSSIATRARSFWATAIILLILTLPSNLIVVTAGLYAVSNDEAVVLHTSDELNAFEWLGENISEGTVILAAPVIGNRLPAYSGARVLFGHPFETPNADESKQRVLDYYAWMGSNQTAITSLQKDGVELIFFGPQEELIGTPNWLEALPVIAEFGEVRIFKVTP